MALLSNSPFANWEFNIYNEEFMPNIEIGILNEDQFDKVLSIAGENFFKGNLTELK